MLINSLLSFAVFAFVASVTPGPNNVILISETSKNGVRSSLKVLLGISIGMSIMTFLIFYGFSELIVKNEKVFNLIKVVSVLFILYMAYGIASSEYTDEKSEYNIDRKNSLGFFGAVFFQWINPKAWVALAGAIGIYYPSGLYDELVIYLLYSVIFCMMAFLGCLPWVVFGVFLKKFLNSKARFRFFHIAMSLLLLSSVFFILV